MYIPFNLIAISKYAPMSSVLSSSGASNRHDSLIAPFPDPGSSSICSSSSSTKGAGTKRCERFHASKSLSSILEYFTRLYLPPGRTSSSSTSAASFGSLGCTTIHLFSAVPRLAPEEDIRFVFAFSIIAALITPLCSFLRISWISTVSLRLAASMALFCAGCAPWS